LAFGDDACSAPIDQHGELRATAANAIEANLACLLKGQKPALLVAEAEISLPLQAIMRACGVSALKLGFRPIGAMHGLSQDADHLLLHLSGAAAWAQRCRSTLHALWHGTDAHASRTSLVWGLRPETDERLAALHFATGLFLGYRPTDCAGYVHRMFRMGTYKHANGSVRLYNTPARRLAIAAAAARLAARIVAPHAAKSGVEGGWVDEVGDESCQAEESAHVERRSPSDAADGRARLLGRLHGGGGGTAHGEAAQRQMI